MSTPPVEMDLALDMGVNAEGDMLVFDMADISAPWRDGANDLDMTTEMDLAWDAGADMPASVACDTIAPNEFSGWSRTLALDADGQSYPVSALLEEPSAGGMATFIGKVESITFEAIPNSTMQRQYVTLRNVDEAHTITRAALRMSVLDHPRTPSFVSGSVYELTYGLNTLDCVFPGEVASSFADSIVLEDISGALVEAQVNAALLPGGAVKLAPGLPFSFDALSWEEVPECLDAPDTSGGHRAAIKVNIGGQMKTLGPGHAEFMTSDGREYAIHNAILKHSAGSAGGCGVWSFTIGPRDKGP